MSDDRREDEVEKDDVEAHTKPKPGGATIEPTDEGADDDVEAHVKPKPGG